MRGDTPLMQCTPGAFSVHISLSHSSCRERPCVCLISSHAHGSHCVLLQDDRAINYEATEGQAEARRTMQIEQEDISKVNVRHADLTVSDT